jgi:hypothetical protein
MELSIEQLETQKKIKTNQRKATKSKKPIAMNDPPPKQPNIKSNTDIEYEQPLNNNHFLGFLPDELKANIKLMAIKALSVPASTRSQILQYKLATSQYINLYLNNYVVFDQLALCNDHIKFALVYGVSMFETMTMSLEQAPKNNNTDNIITDSLQPEVPINNKNDESLSGLNPM